MVGGGGGAHNLDSRLRPFFKAQSQAIHSLTRDQNSKYSIIINVRVKPIKSVNQTDLD